MIGAGFSRNTDKYSNDVPGIPIWEDLADSMLKDLYPSRNNSVSSCKSPRQSQPEPIIQIAQEYEVAFGKQKLYKLIKDQVRDNDYAPGDFHTRLLRLPWRDIFTTNWDTLLERTRPLVVERGYGLVRNTNEIPLSPRPRIIKLHGCLSQHNHLIFTEEDYRTYPIKYSPFVNTVQQAMMETVFLLIGFSGNDPNFLHWSGWVRDNMGESAPLIYLAGYLNLSTHKRRMLEARNVIPIDLSCHPMASEWPDESRNEYAMNWLLTSLELGQPYEISDWPEISTHSTITQKIYLEPIQKQSETTPLSEHEPQQILGNQPNEDIDEVQRIIKIWSHNRKLYPGWIVIPFSKVRKLNFNTQEWENKILSSISNLSAADKLPLISELIWRKTILLEPLNSNDLIKLLLDILNVIDCKAKTIEGISVSDKNWLEIREKWIMLATALLREARYEINHLMFKEWLEKLSQFKDEDREVYHMLQHEECLWAITLLDFEKLIALLNDWNVTKADSRWKMRKSALMFEVGNAPLADQVANEALENIRRQPSNDKTLEKPSKEGWALWRVFNWSDKNQNQSEIFRRWEELAVLKCNSSAEMNRYTEALKEKEKKEESRPFDLDRQRGQRISFANSEEYHKFMAAYRAIGLSEKAGLSSVHAEEMLKLAAKILAPYKPGLSLRLILRTATFDRDKIFDSILSRTRIASIEKDIIEGLAEDVTRAIEFTLSKIYSRENSNLSVSWWDRLRVLVEALSRFAVRVNDQMVEDIFANSVRLYSDGDIARHPFMLNPIKNLLARSWESLSNQQKMNRVQDLLEAPIADSNQFIVSSPHYPDPYDLLHKSDFDIPRNYGDENRWKDILNFLINSIQKNDETRKRASIRMLWLIDQQIPTDEENKRIIDAIWGNNYANKEYLPEGTGFLDWEFLTIPEPETGISETRFRKKWLNVSTEISEIQENLFEVLWQVGMAIDYLKEKGRDFILSTEEREYLSKIFIIWSQSTKPQVRHFGNGEPQLINGTENIYKALEGLRTILPEIKLSHTDGEILYEKIQRLKSYNISTIFLSAGLMKALPSHAHDIEQDMRMGLASDKEFLAVDSVRGLLYWLQTTSQENPTVLTPPIDLVREIGVIIAIRRKAALAMALQVAKWIFQKGSHEQKESIGKLVSQGLGFLLQELDYKQNPDPDFNVPLLRWGCTHLAIAMSESGFDQDQNIKSWLKSARSDPLPEVRNAFHGDESSQFD